MKTFVSIFHNPETDDTYAAIIQDDKCFCYSHFGQHSKIVLSYLRDSNASKLTGDSISLWNEVKSIYREEKPELIDDVEFNNIIDNEQIIFEL
tara:strand:+ start:325 stop:603 length:279 start_codon:yes stop_codon:yes gene_type:complete